MAAWEAYQQNHHVSLLETLSKKLLPICGGTYSFCIRGRDAALLHETAPRCCASWSWCRKVVVNVLQVRGHPQKAEPQRNSGIILSWVSVPVTHVHSRHCVWPWVLGLLASLCVTRWEAFFFFFFLITFHHEKNVSVYGSEKSLTLNLELAGKEHNVMLWGRGYGDIASRELVQGLMEFYSPV